MKRFLLIEEYLKASKKIQLTITTFTILSMKKIYLTLAILLLAFTDRINAQNLGEGAVIEQAITVDGIERSYLLYIPPSYDGSEPWPLVLNFHGFNSQSDFQMFVTGMNAVADENNFIIAYPQGLLIANPFLGNDAPGWNVGGTLSKNDDVGFANSLIDKVIEDYSIDESRIYATGWSMGANMAYDVTCALGDRIAAVAGVANQMADFQIAACKPIRSIPTLVMHGTADPLVPFEGDGAIFSEVATTVLFWANSNNCLLEPETISLEDTDLEDGSSVMLTKYTNCDRSTEVLFYTVVNGGHPWPGGGALPPFTGTLNKDINASEEIWDFFKKFSLPDLEKLPKVDEFVLVDAVNNKELTVLEDNAIINLVTLEKDRLSIVAKSSSDNTESILLELTGPIEQRQLENIIPYALFGDNNSNYRGKKLPVGIYSLKASPFDADAIEGDMGLRNYLTFEVVEDTFIRDFTLVDANTNESLMILEDGSLFNLDETGNELNIKANIYPEQVGSIEFMLDGVSKIENVKPYSVFGDINGNYFVGDLNVGTHVLVAKAYERPRAMGGLVAHIEISFEVTTSSASRKMSKLYQNEPNPFSGITNIRAFVQPSVQNAKIAIFDDTGTLIQEMAVDQRGEINIKANIPFSRKGMYYLRLVTDGKHSDSKKMILR